MNRNSFYEAPAEVANQVKVSTMLSPAKEMPVGMALSVPKDFVPRKLLDALVADMGVSEKKKFVVTEHGDVYAVSRLPDDYNLATWERNRSTAPIIENEIQKQVEKIKAACLHFINCGWADVFSYCGESLKIAFDCKVVPYSYLQRRFAAIEIFQTDKLGSTAAIKRAIARLEEEGFLETIGKFETKQNYATGSRCFRLLKIETKGVDG